MNGSCLRSPAWRVANLPLPSWPRDYRAMPWKRSRCSKLWHGRIALWSPSRAAEWPDGTYSGSYAFQHILYQNVLYQRLTPGRRAQIHRRMGERLREGYGKRTADIAPTLALHFEHGRDFPNALRYLSQAAESSAKRLGHEEAANYLTRALGILDRLEAGDQYGPRIALLRQRSWARRSSGDLAGSVARS